MPEPSDRQNPGANAVRDSRGRVRRLLLVAIGLLYALSIPWYRDVDAEVGRLFGWPDWVAVSIGCYAIIAVLNAAAWLLTEVPDAVDDDASQGGP